MNVTLRTVPAADLLSLASLPMEEPTMISVDVPLDSEVVRRVITASIPSVSIRKPTISASTVHAPRSSREHIALGGA